MSDKVYNVPFICTGNSARSIMAEGLNPFALQTLNSLAGMSLQRKIDQIGKTGA